LGIFNQFFTHLLNVPIYARLQIFIQLSPTLMKLCHIKRDYPVHIICSKWPPSTEMHAFRHSIIDRCLGQATKNKHFYNVNKHVGYDMTSTVTSFAQ